MARAFFLALGQLSDRRILAVLAKSLALTAVIVGAVGWALFRLLERLFSDYAVLGDMVPEASGLRGLAFTVFLLVTGWVLFRVVAPLVLQFFADDVVAAVEQRHYPDAAAAAASPGWRAELRLGLGGACRAIAINVLALPLLLVLLVTGIGTALAFWAINAWLLGRELSDMVRIRHTGRSAAIQPIGRLQRAGLGGVVAGLMLVPFANILAPLIGAAMATHLLHRKEALPHAA